MPHYVHQTVLNGTEYMRHCLSCVVTRVTGPGRDDPDLDPTIKQNKIRIPDRQGNQVKILLKKKIKIQRPKKPYPDKYLLDCSFFIASVDKH